MTAHADASLVQSRLPAPQGPALHAAPARALRGLRVALVNNMPDGALVATERQFTGLVERATGGHARIDLYYLPSLTRGADARAILNAHYRPIADLYRSGADAVIVTGNEPRAAQLQDEPYWDDMVALTTWAKDHTLSTLWSCLAAHAAILHLDGIARRHLGDKLSGVYACASPGEGRASTLTVCHSRFNEAPRDALLKAGYTILSESPGGHVDAFTKSWRSRFLFLQGHPEYEADSLAREFKRDVTRYLNGQRETYPNMPANYFDAATARKLEDFRGLAERERTLETLKAYPSVALRQGLSDRLAQSAEAVFEQWMAEIAARR